MMRVRSLGSRLHHIGFLGAPLASGGPVPAVGPSGTASRWAVKGSSWRNPGEPGATAAPWRGSPVGTLCLLHFGSTHRLITRLDESIPDHSKQTPHSTAVTINKERELPWSTA